MDDISTHRSAAQRNRGGVRLGLSLGVIAVVWCVVLPWIARRPVMEEHLNWLDDRGIDPSAMYYTELEMMDPILQRLERQRRFGDSVAVTGPVAVKTTVRLFESAE